MNRLTEWQPLNTSKEEQHAVLKDGVSAQDAYNLLAQFEDKCVEPRDMLNPVELAEIAVALMKLKTYESLGLSPTELKKAKEDGCLFIFPCKIGDIVYHNELDADTQRIRPIKYKVVDISIPQNDDGTPKDIILYIGRERMECRASEIGKEFFLTYEEAKAN